MVQLKCDLCGENLVMASGGKLVCQNCGIEYSQERIKEKLQEATGGEPVAAAQPMQADQSQKIDQYYEMILTALESHNFAEAESYCNKVIDIDINHFKAWMYKGTAVSWQSTFGNIRVDEGVNCYSTGLAKCPDEKEKQDLIKYADRSFSDVITAMFKLAAGFVADGMNNHNANSFLSHNKLLLNLVSLYKLKVNNAFNGKDLLNRAMKPCVSACKSAAKAKAAQFHRNKPTTEGGNTAYRKDVFMCCEVCAQLAQIPGVPFGVQADCGDTCADIVEIVDQLGFYIWFDGTAVHRDNKVKCTDNIVGFRRTAASCRQKAQQEYWDEHPEEYKAHLEAIKAEEERKKREEKEKKDAFETFWKRHAAEKQAIEAEIKELNDMKLSDGGQRGVVRLINGRIGELNSILTNGRQPDASFTDREKGVINGRPQFDRNCESARKKKKLVKLLVIAGVLTVIAVIVGIIIVISNINSTRKDAFNGFINNGQGAAYSGTTTDSNGNQYTYLITVRPTNTESVYDMRCIVLNKKVTSFDYVTGWPTYDYDSVIADGSMMFTESSSPIKSSGFSVQLNLMQLKETSYKTIYHNYRSSTWCKPWKSFTVTVESDGSVTIYTSDYHGNPLTLTKIK